MHPQIILLLATFESRKTNAKKIYYKPVASIVLTILSLNG